jgi:CRP/FNR family cyclic AMP-dependent transcriptional regulator
MSARSAHPPVVGGEAQADGPAALLARSDLFGGLDPETLADLAAAARLRSWPARSLIFARGDVGDYLLVVQKGSIRLSLSSARGRELVLGTLGPGAVIGEIALIDGEPRSADATAVAATTCLVLPRARFETVAARRPCVGMALARHLARMVRNSTFQVEAIALHDVQTRLVRFLLHLLAAQADKGEEARRRLVLGMTQADVAAILGATRPKVSLAFGALVAAGAVRRDGEALVCDTEILAAMAEGDPD